jgi:hypothetical protein
MLQQELAVADDQRMLEWGIRMYVVSPDRADRRQRGGHRRAGGLPGHGEFREFTDASHPEIEHPELLEGGGSPD